MAWIKRNLLFVIAMAVGLALVGVAGYFAYTAIGANNDARDQYNTALNDLTTLEKKNPYPSPQNIQIAKEDSEHVAAVVKDMGASFVNFPTPPSVSPEQFIGILNSNLNYFRMRATNANVLLVSPDFSFSVPAHQLSFTINNFGPWMQQLQEIGAIVDVLCNAKVNSLDSIQRAAVPGEDPTGVDFLPAPAAITSNQVSITSPYKIVFRGFSEEVAKVLEGFAKSPYCFLVKDIQITPTKGAPMGELAGGQPAQQYIMMPVAVPGTGGASFGRRRRGGGEGGFQPPQVQYQQVAVAVPATPTGPVTILKPMPLFITMSLDCVQLRKAER